jgi:hypothetical protein
MMGLRTTKTGSEPNLIFRKTPFSQNFRQYDILEQLVHEAGHCNCSITGILICVLSLFQN